MKKYVALLLLGFVFATTGIAQTGRDARLKMKGYVNPQEIVSLDSTMRMDQALLVINELSKQFAGKIIIDLEKHKGPIGVYVVNQHWRDALDLIMSHNGLTAVEEADYIRIASPGSNLSGMLQGKLPSDKGEPPPTLDAKDIKISAAFFRTDLTKLQNYGISWNFFRSKSKEPTLTGYLASGLGRGDTASPVPPVSQGTATAQTPSLNEALAVIQSPPEFKFANIDALVKFYGSNDLGEVINSPDIVVRNGKPGRIQVGKDIFVTTRDIAGNTVNQEISTGTIIEVTPVIYTQNDTDFVYLDIKIEQSDATTGPEINRATVTTHAILYDGEETVVGGLLTTLDQTVRDGIPFLKDLPGWFLGLRYLFGSEQITKTKSELIIMLKVELSKSVRDRMVHRATHQDLIEDKRQEFQNEFNKK
jgi:hypothetical protein